MLVNNQFKIFNKTGDNINPDYLPYVEATIIDPDGTGRNASLKVFTDYSGVIIHVQIVDGGFNYSANSYVTFSTRPEITKTWETDPSDLTINVTGEITGFTIPSSSINIHWPFPGSYSFSNYFLDNVSAGLIESENFFLIEKVLDVNGDIAYTHPRVDEYGPFFFSNYVADGEVATLDVRTVSSLNTGNIDISATDQISNVNLSITASLVVGMNVTGVGIPSNTSVIDINYAIGTIILNSNCTPGVNLNLTFYIPHKLKIGSKISIHSGTLQGIHTVTGLSELAISFKSNVINSSALLSTYGVVPQFRAQLSTSSDEEWFLYDIEYGTTYPTITKTKSIDFELTNASLATIPDTFSGGNGEFIRQVFDRLEKRPFQLNIGVQADVEGVYIGEVDILDVTFTTSSKLLFNTLVECEVESEDERLGLLLENFGRDINFEEEAILRDSDISEGNTNFILLNQKRKEMLLQGDEIWPYVGSYKGLVNMVNWFGYYDIRIKEYFLNVNATDVNYGKYRQVQIPFQLASKGENPETERLVPSKNYKKTSQFGLYYDIVRNSGDYDTFGVPITEDSFTYTNEEALIKLFGLKKYLKEKFLPLNTRIVDITGEGVYYERYAVNSWNDRNNRFLIDVGKKLEFTHDKTSQIVDLRPYNSNGGLLTPELDSSIGELKNYSFNNVIITSGGSYFMGEIPSVIFTGSAIQQAKGKCRVRGMVCPSTLYSGALTGVGYAIGDIITLSGGVYEVPLRIEVTGVNTGAVTAFKINAGPQQGSNYASLPTTFGVLSVLRSSGTQYYTPDAFGFTIDALEIPFEVQDVTLYDLGLNYSTYPIAQFLWDLYSSPAATTPIAVLNVKQNGAAAVSYYNDDRSVKKFGDSPDIPVGAIINMSTTFDVAWDELPYSWATFSGSNDATLKAWTDVSPSGTGQLVAVEIVSTGTDYSFNPTFTVTGGGGYSAAVSGQIKAGKLIIVEHSVSSVVAPNQLVLSPNIATAGLNIITPGHIVKGVGIPDGTIISSVVGNDIYLISYDGSPTITTIVPGQPVYVHQGVTVITGGADFTSDPLVSPNGGHTSTLYTWEELGRGNSYQMEWKIFLTSPDDPTKVFNTQSGVSTIDALINYQTTVPYTGKYTIQLDVYDTNNSISNKIKHDVVEVYIPESDFAFITKNVDDCKDTWDEFHQIQQPVNLQTQFTPSAPIDQPIPIVYDWNHATGRWINVTFNNTDWNDCDINWDTLSITDLSDINNPTYPDCSEIEVLQISAEDYLEGNIISYTDNTTVPSTINPTIIVAGQKNLPELDPVYDATDWIFIRRGDITYHLEVISTNYSVIGQTTIELATKPPLAFKKNPVNWELLREIGGTVVVKGNQIYNVNTNPTGFKIGQYLKLSKNGITPISKRNIISSKTTDSFNIKNGFNINNLQKPGSYGRAYKVRDYMFNNGNLNWSTSATAVDAVTSITGTGQSGVQTIGSPTQTTKYGQPINTFSSPVQTLPGQSLYYVVSQTGGAGAPALNATYTGLTVLSSGTGIGAVASVVTNALGQITIINITTPGTGYKATDIITIAAGWDGGGATAITLSVLFTPVSFSVGSSGAGTGATFIVAYDTAGVRTVTLVNGGINYAIGNTITIAGGLVGGATPANNITFTVSTLLPQVYTNVPCTSSLSGTGSAYNVTYDSLGLLTVAIATAGTNYIVTELITINSVNVGGAPASNITFTVSSLVPITFTGIASSLTSGVGSGVLLNIGLNSAGNYVLPAQPINYGGINYAIGNTITIPGASLGVINSTAGNNCVVTVSALSLASSWVFQSTSINPEISDHTGRLLINKNRSTCDILDEIHPGFSRINLYAFSGTLGRNITSIKNITATLGPVGVFTNVVSTSSVDGVNATFNVTRTLASTTITINNSGTRYEIGETITLLGSNVGGGSNITFVVNDITMPSKDDMIYSQIFRTRHAYLDSSNVGTTYSVWNNNPYVVDVIGLNGGKLYDLNNALISYQTQHGKDFSCYLEYEYDDFTTRERYYAGSSPNETLYLDYNVFPASDEFNTSTNFGTIYDDDHTNWFYDHGIVGNDYSLLILNTGVWKNGVGTILTLDDSNSELYKTDTFFLACQQSFDEDYAETHIGTRVQNWANYTEITWSTFCGNTWDTLDYSDSLWCSYVIDIVNTNGGIKFNEYPTFNFSGIIGGMSDPEKFSQALWELNNSDNPGISKFDYSIYAGILGGAVFNYAIPGWIDPAYYINSIQKIGSAKLNTYIAQNVVFYNNTASIVALDVLYGNTFVEPATVVTSVVTGSTIDPGYAGFVAAYVSKNIPKKAKFTADSTASSNRLKNVIGLQAGSLRVGEVITGINLPSYPAVPAKVVQIVVVNGVIRDIVLDTYIQVTENYGYFEVEWITPDNTFITIPWLDATLTQADIQIFATAKNPSVDNLGYLVGTNGVTFLPPQYPSSLINTTTSHTFPMSNFYSWFGFGENKVGSFQYGLQEFLTKYRYAQSYLNLGTSPFGEPGWYPASNLPLPYTYTNNPTFDNYLNARAQSERLPYERSIGGAYTWEETRIGKYTTKIPVGSSVLLSAESSDIAGKTKYFWRIKEGNTILAETTDNRISWTYDYTGNFDVELTITDTNGNKSTKTKKSFLNIYEAAE